jgi:hypothetical protein
MLGAEGSEAPRYGKRQNPWASTPSATLNLLRLSET